jgi:hypothetical protein
MSIMPIMAHNGLCIYIIHYVQFIILGGNPGLWTLWTDYEHYELPESLMIVSKESAVAYDYMHSSMESGVF